MKFRVIDTEAEDGTPDMQKIALKEEWAKGLIWCDMEGFAIGEDGALYLLDECGYWAYCPPGRFKVVWEEKP